MSCGPYGRYVKKCPQGYEEFTSKVKLSPPAITMIETHGKLMWWSFKFDDQETWHMHSTYGMSGGWYISPSKHTAFIVETQVDSNGSKKKLFFNDPRHFGTLKFIKGDQQHHRKLKTLGPCVLGGNLSPGLFAEKILKKPNRTIAEALMDQSTLAGIGNYLKSEILYRTRISPWRQVTDITQQEYIELCNNSVLVSTESYESQGATIATYRTPDGSKGKKQFDFDVYSKTSCPMGHDVIRQVTPEGRTSHWCKFCQT